MLYFRLLFAITTCLHIVHHHLFIGIATLTLGRYLPSSPHQQHELVTHARGSPTNKSHPYPSRLEKRRASLPYIPPSTSLLGGIFYLRTRVLFFLHHSFLKIHCSFSLLPLSPLFFSIPHSIPLSYLPPPFYLFPSHRLHHVHFLLCWLFICAHLHPHLRSFLWHIVNLSSIT